MSRPVGSGSGELRTILSGVCNGLAACSAGHTGRPVNSRLAGNCFRPSRSVGLRFEVAIRSIFQILFLNEPGNGFTGSGCGPAVKAARGRFRRPVGRVLYRPFPGGDGHSSGTPVSGRLVRPTRAAGAEAAGRSATLRPAAPIRSCSRWGLPCRPRCRGRGALLPPRFTLAGRQGVPGGPAVCFLWHFPWGRPRRALPGTVPPWSPDLPHRARRPARPSGLLNRGSIQTFSSSSRKRASSSHSSSSAANSDRARSRRSAARANRSGSRS